MTDDEHLIRLMALKTVLYAMINNLEKESVEVTKEIRRIQKRIEQKQ